MFIPHLKALIEQQDSSGRPEDTHLALVLSLLGNVYGDLGDVAKKRDLLLRALKLKRPTTAQITGSCIHPSKLRQRLWQFG